MYNACYQSKTVSVFLLCFSRKAISLELCRHAKEVPKIKVNIQDIAITLKRCYHLRKCRD